MEEVAALHVRKLNRLFRENINDRDEGGHRVLCENRDYLE